MKNQVSVPWLFTLKSPPFGESLHSRQSRHLFPDALPTVGVSTTGLVASAVLATQSDLHICKLHICGFNQLWIEIEFKPLMVISVLNTYRLLFFSLFLIKYNISYIYAVLSIVSNLKYTGGCV